MDVMSYTCYLCLVIILFSHYGSLQNSNDLVQAENYDQEANTHQLQFKSSSLTNAEDEPKDEPEAEPKDELKDEPTDELKDETTDELKDEPTDELKDELKDEPTDELKDELKDEPTDEPENELKGEPNDELNDASNDKFDEAISTENEDKAEESSGEFKVYVKSSGEDFVKTPATFNWPTGIVPYVIGKMYDPLVRERIRFAMRIIESSSCVRFKKMRRKPVKGQHFDVTWLSIENRDGVRECSHSSMREEGFRGTKKAILIIGYDCMTRQDILHALLHALGFRDEVTHPQRDQYIRVMWANIQPKYRKLFWMRTGDPPHKTVEYDSMSIMHFHDRAFSINGGPTVMPLVPGLLISPSKTLSQIDVMKLRLAFGHECNKRKVNNLLQTCQNVLQNDDEEQTHSQYSTSPKDPADPEDPTYAKHVTHLIGPGGPEGLADSDVPTFFKNAILFKRPVDPEHSAYAEGSTDSERSGDSEGSTVYEGQLNYPIHLKDPGGPEGPADPKNPINAKYATLFKGPGGPKRPADPKNTTNAKYATLFKGHGGPKGSADPAESTYAKYAIHLKGPGGSEGPADPTNAKYATLVKGPRGPKDPADPKNPTNSKYATLFKGPRGPKGPAAPESSASTEGSTDPEGPIALEGPGDLINN